MRVIKEVAIELHSLCNLKCSICLNKNRHMVDNKVLEIEYVDKAVDNLKYFDKLESVELHCFNQPILKYSDIDKINNIYDKIKKTYDLSIRLSSNITMTKEFNYSDINDLKIDGLYLTRYRKQDPSFDEILMNVNNIINVNRVDEFIYQIETINKKIIFKDWSDLNIKNYSNYETTYKLKDRGGSVSELSKTKRTSKCNRNEITINYNGSVMPCCHLHSDTHPEMILGNIKDNTLDEIIKCDKSKTIYNSINDFNSKSCEFCIGCMDDFKVVDEE